MSATTSGNAKGLPIDFHNRTERVKIVFPSGQMGKDLTEPCLLRGNLDDYASEVEDDIAASADALRGQQALLVTKSHKVQPTTKLLIRAAATIQAPYIPPSLSQKSLIAMSPT
ncbi:hypothetical protein E8E12_006900 [Didymella heteroderae]|uniref:Uncharacterized protein n=1 Tax=Didymella heteroderae TaxID=1769908 RepID=A0A9P5BXY4_9PLEO|nr:hypothetical protein E8E12_006900 [Didymella heteroderae]